MFISLRQRNLITSDKISSDLKSSDKLKTKKSGIKIWKKKGKDSLGIAWWGLCIGINILIYVIV